MNDGLFYFISSFTEPIGSRVCDRTLKFFKGISQGCWILDYEWVVDSRAAGNLLQEVYLINVNHM